jgi:histidinol-phosphate aminotransferase
MSSDTLHFEAAINPYGCSPKVVEAIESGARAKDYRFYGDADARGLREKLAAHHSLSPGNFIVYNGAGEALAWLFILNLLVPRGRLIVPHPSYERFVEAGRRCAAEVIEVPLDESNFSLPLDRLIEEANRKHANVGLISSPNNPTGNLLLDQAALDRLLDEAPRCLWIVDEAYADYAGVSFVSSVRERRNLFVLRTFSKIYGLAGLRVGCAVAHADTARALAQTRLPWCVNSLSLVAAEAALADQNYVRRTLARIGEDCRRFKSALDSISYLKAHPSAANFFLIQLDADESRLKEYLGSNKIQVRSRPDMPRHLRITSLLPEQNNFLIDVLAAYNPKSAASLAEGAAS